MQLEKGGRTAAINYLAVVNAFLADIVLFGETVQATDLMGAMCCCKYGILIAIENSVAWLQFAVGSFYQVTIIFIQ